MKRKSPDTADKPIIKPDISTLIPLKKRQKTLDLIHSELLRIYSSQPDCLARSSAEAVERELAIKQESTEVTYGGKSVAALMKLKKEKVLEVSEVKVVGLKVEDLAKVVMSREVLKLYGYPLYSDIKGLKVGSSKHVSINDAKDESMVAKTANVADVKKNTPTEKEPKKPETCDRCGSKFIVNYPLNDQTSFECQYHSAKLYKRKYTCCSEPSSSPGCTSGPHVFRKYPDATKQLRIHPPKYYIVALDCEMGYTTMGMEVIRASIVNHEKIVLYDRLIKPIGQILDLNTKYSGISSIPEDAVGLDDLFTWMNINLSQDTIFIGHGLENDFIAMGFVHERVVDTCALYEHPKGLPFRNGLKGLMKNVLGRVVQSSAHDSVEDAKFCVDLVQRYLSNPPPHS